MLLNILHTIAITCAVGTNLCIGKPLQRNLQPNRANNIYNYSQENNGNVNYKIYKNIDNDPLYPSTEIYISGQGQYELRYDYTYNDGQIVDQATTINWIIWDRTPKIKPYGSLVASQEQNLITYTRSAKNEAITDSTIGSTTVVGYERLLFFKYQPNGRLLDNTININYYLYSTIKNIQDSTITSPSTELFIKQVITKNDVIEPLFNQDSYEWSDHILVNNLSTTFDNYLYEMGSNSTVEYQVEQVQRESGATTINTTRNITIYENETTYILIYLQPRVVGSDVNTLVKANSRTDSDILGSFTYNNTYTGSLYMAPSGTTEVVDIPGVMIYVLGMPFTFVSTAFNLTLFPNTPYEVNLSTLFLGILAVLIFVFLIKLIIGGLNKGGGE